MLVRSLALEMEAVQLKETFFDTWVQDKSNTALLGEPTPQWLNELANQKKMMASRTRRSAMVHIYFEETGMLAGPGDWIVRYPSGLVVFPDEAFRRLFRPTEETPHVH